MAVTEQAVMEALRQVPAERWEEVLSFVQSLRPVPSSYTAADLLESGLVGIWADRDDIGDSREFARRLRREAEHGPGASILLDSEIQPPSGDPYSP